MSTTLILVDVLVALLFVVGLVGALLPIVPGPLLILVGAFIHGAATGFAVIGPGRLAILGALVVVGYVLGHLASALGVRRSGGSGWAIVGAVAGALLGLVLGPLGLIVGPAVGAVLLELVVSRDLDKSVRSGLGAVLGIAAGAIAHLSLAVMMIALFLWWVWRG